MKSLRWLLLLIALPVLAACGTLDANVQLRLDDQYSYLTVTIPEEDVVAVIEAALEQSGDIQNVSADLRAGEIAATGQVLSGDGTLVTGSLTIAAGVEAEMLVLEVVRFDFAGWSLPQARIDTINADIAAGIVAAIAQGDGRSTLTDITLTDTALSFTIRSLREG